MKMRSAGVMSLASLVGLLMAPSAAMAQIILYDGLDFKGESLQLDESTEFLGPLGFNDKASSIEVIEGTWTVYEHADGEGSSKDYTPGKYPKITPNNKASSVLLNPAATGRPEGARCTSDAQCEGYCENLRCWDGSKGDDCGKDSDCQDSLTCAGVRPLAKCSSKKPEGAKCGSDADCEGYCEILQCWDGSKGDRCGSSRDCQGNLSCKFGQKCHKPCKFCPRVCLPQVFRTCR